jgi:hypothetical protein
MIGPGTIQDYARTSHADATYYVDPAFNGNGSATNPFHTFEEALARFPKDGLDHNLNIRIKGGTVSPLVYTDNIPDTWRGTLERNGQFIVECIDPPIKVAGPFTVTGVTVRGTTAGLDIVVAGAGWTPNEFYKTFMRFTNVGIGQGHCLPIGKHTADTIPTIHSGYPTPTIGDTFEIVQPAAQFNTAHGISFDFRGLRAQLRSQVVLSNIAFKDTSGADPANQFVNSYCWLGDVNATVGCCIFQSDQPVVGPYIQRSGAMGFRPPLDISQLVDKSLISYPAVPYAWGSMILALKDTPPTTAVTGALIAGAVGPGNDTGAEIHRVLTCGQIYSYAGKGTLAFADVEGFVADHGSVIQCDSFRTRSTIAGVYPLRVDDSCTVQFYDFHIDEATGHAISVEDAARLQITGGTANTGAIVGHGLAVGKGSKVVCDGSDITGTAGAIQWTNRATPATVAYPAVHASVTDGAGAEVIK